MSENHFSKETIEKYMKEMMDLSKKSTLPEGGTVTFSSKPAEIASIAPKLQPEPVSPAVCQVCTENKFPDLSNNMFTAPPAKAPVPGTAQPMPQAGSTPPAPETTSNLRIPPMPESMPKPQMPPVMPKVSPPVMPPVTPSVMPPASNRNFQDDVDQYFQELKRSREKTPESVPPDSYIDDIDEYTKEKEKADAKASSADISYENDVYIDDIDKYLRKKEEFERSVLQATPDEGDVRETINRPLDVQADLFRPVSNIPQKQRMHHESDIFINSIGWDTAPEAAPADQTVMESRSDQVAGIAEEAAEEPAAKSFEWPVFSTEPQSRAAGEAMTESTNPPFRKSAMDWEITPSTVPAAEVFEEAEPEKESTEMLRPHYKAEEEVPVMENLPETAGDIAEPEKIIDFDVQETISPMPTEENLTPSDLIDTPTDNIPCMEGDSLTDVGYLWVEVTMGNGTVPVSDAIVVISHQHDDFQSFNFKAVTNENGEIPRISLAAPSRDRSLKPGSDVPYQPYNVDIFKEGFYTSRNNGVQLFGGVDTFLPVTLIPLPENTLQAGEEIETIIPPNDL